MKNAILMILILLSFFSCKNEESSKSQNKISSIEADQIIKEHIIKVDSGLVKVDTTDRGNHRHCSINGKRFEFHNGTLPEDVDNSKIIFVPFYLRIPIELSGTCDVIGDFALCLKQEKINKNIQIDEYVKLSRRKKRGPFGCVPKLLAEKKDHKYNHIKYVFDNDYYLPMAAALHYDKAITHGSNNVNEIICHGVYYKTDKDGYDSVNKHLDSFGIDNLEAGLQGPIMPDDKIKDIYVFKDIEFHGKEG